MIGVKQLTMDSKYDLNASKVSYECLFLSQRVNYHSSRTSPLKCVTEQIIAIFKELLSIYFELS